MTIPRPPFPRRGAQVNRMRHRFHAPGSTAETPDEQCKHSQQSKRTEVRVALFGIGGVARVILLFYAWTVWRLAFVTPAYRVITGVAILAGVANGQAMACEGYLGDKSRVSEGVVRGARNQKREKQNADGRK